MISLKLKSVPTLFAQGFSSEDVEAIIGFVREADSMSEEFRDTILFIDTPATPPLVEAVSRLKSEGYRVVFRDHHAVAGEPANVRDRQKVQATEKLRKMLGDDCLITLRELHPACSTLTKVGEFADALAIIADPDADGLTAAMKAAGIYYDGLDEDAALLDSEPALQVTGSEISSLLAKGLATLPSYDPKRPREREEIQQKLFGRWVDAVAGDESAIAWLREGEKAYDDAVDVSRELVSRAEPLAPGVVLVDVTESPVFDVGTLNSSLESEPSCKVIVLKKDKGPIAALHGVQFSLSVAKSFHSEVNLKELIPQGANNNPSTGIISNVTFLLHVSDTVWFEHVLPAIKERFAG